ncbi:MAG: CpsB/CapC family capsule biosynthesis tyrosine phosphatase [Acutalibacteraceae bacterium]|nr:CpsB/CapC family capsule biosynthesis tyrosine phosphatase [Acutalibacteraceae bacterium]
MNKYDIHTHILPAIDDGAYDVDISLVLLEELERQGVTHLALTPHFYTQRSDMSQSSINKFVSARKSAFDELKAVYNGKIKLILGCELHLTENILKADDISPFCYSGTNYLLTEMPYYSKFPQNEIELLNVLIKHYKVIPVLAHIERYPVLLSNTSLLERLIDMGCITQVNTESFANFFRSKRLVKLINNGYIYALGSDTHSTTHGCDYAKGYNYIEFYCKPDKLEFITENSRKIFGE